MKKTFGVFCLVIALISLISYGQTRAQDENSAPVDQATATSEYATELTVMGMDAATAQQKAQTDVAAVIGSMGVSKSSVSDAYDLLSSRVDQLLSNDTRRTAAKDALDTAKASKEAFEAMAPESNLFVQKSIAGAPPVVMPGAAFQTAQQTAENDQSVVNRILIAPIKPGTVPEGDIVTGFLPQIIRQLFRFAWLAVLVAFIVSGVMLVMAHDDDAKVTKARQMIYYTLIGFAFVAFAFAIVKAVTNIDFFKLI